MRQPDRDRDGNEQDRDADGRLRSFDAFWPYYVGEHALPATRTLHFVGTTAAALCLAGAIVTRRPALILAGLIAGYGPAWVSHFFIEKNRPATFTYPAWSLLADFKMWSMTAKGEMDAEVERVRVAREAAASAASNGASATDLSADDEAASATRPSSVLN